ncbi:Fe-S oxidoreductase [Nitratireductor aquibiodomus RA22]|uniref:Fe-S oxidoreductase n=1 Tax=Nitratireductor aquibiodomus RA22 TaxID=1189611 RepID=I5BSU7_9HYPH|nr:B12-binding domain-containing radical SAM protein [Nitratireductor aquibiodomus]EIM72649.1 Fe-S oxidoreductase [Nitratireductor aquibiodomus RA22]
MKPSIYIVNAGNDPKFASISNDGCYPALGVLALGTWIKKNIPEVDVVVRDGQVFPLVEILDEIQQLRPFVVGVSVLATSYENALAIAGAAKKIGAYTVFGNDQVAQLSGYILERREEVDFVVCSEYGEKPFELLIRCLLNGSPSLEEIPEIAYRQAGSIRGFDYVANRDSLSILKSPHYMAQSRKNALDIFPIVDRTLYPITHWHRYRENYLRRFAHLHTEGEVTGVTAINRARGCSRANENIKCKFCDMLLDISFSSASIFWQEVEQAHEEMGATIFYEVCDSLTSFPPYIRSLVEAKPESLGFEPKFFVYAQAIDIVRTPDLPKLLRELGVFRVNIGLESGSDPTLKHLKGQHDSVETNYAAVKMLRAEGIHVYGSFVLGSDVETQKTLRETTDWAKKLLDENLLVDLSVQPLAPLPHNLYGKRLKADGVVDALRLAADEPWPIDGLAKIYIDSYSGVSYEDTLQCSVEVLEYARHRGVTAGSGASSAEKYN